MVSCSSCGAPDAPSKCSKCLSVSYCNRSCQLNHWHEHKQQCTSARAAANQNKAAASENDQDSSSPVAGVQAGANNAPAVKAAEDDAFSAPSKMCIARIHTDLKALSRDPLEGIFVEHDEERVNVCHAIILGPSDTPYEFGFYYFLLEFPDQYPCVPPRVTLKTTGGGRVRFNPNLYANGRVCLSILGTWQGPSWSPAQNIGSVLLSIRSLLNSTPYFNEPGFENKPPQESRTYNQFVRHETIRVAVLEMMDLATTPCDNFLPQGLASVVQSSFFDFCEVYKYVCEEYSFLDGKTFRDPLSTNRGTFRFQDMKARLERMQEEVELKGGQEDEEDNIDELAPSATLTADESSSSSP